MSPSSCQGRCFCQGEADRGKGFVCIDRQQGAGYNLNGNLHFSELIQNCQQKDFQAMADHEFETALGVS